MKEKIPYYNMAQNFGKKAKEIDNNQLNEQKEAKKEKLVNLTIWASTFLLIVIGVLLMFKLANMPVKISGFQDNTNTSLLFFLSLIVLLSFLFLIIIPIWTKRRESFESEAVFMR